MKFSNYQNPETYSILRYYLSITDLTEILLGQYLGSKVFFSNEYSRITIPY